MDDPHLWQNSSLTIISCYTKYSNEIGFLSFNFKSLPYLNVCTILQWKFSNSSLNKSSTIVFSLVSIGKKAASPKRVYLGLLHWCAITYYNSGHSNAPSLTHFIPRKINPPVNRYSTIIQYLQQMLSLKITLRSCRALNSMGSTCSWEPIKFEEDPFGTFQFWEIHV